MNEQWLSNFYSEIVAMGVPTKLRSNNFFCYENFTDVELC